MCHVCEFWKGKCRLRMGNDSVFMDMEGEPLFEFPKKLFEEIKVQNYSDRCEELLKGTGKLKSIDITEEKKLNEIKYKRDKDSN